MKEKMSNAEITAQNKQRIDELFEKVKTMSDAEYYAFLMKMSEMQYRYSYRNKMILILENASWCMGFRQWMEKYHRFVKKGESAIWILAPRIVTEEKESKENPDEKLSEKHCVGFQSVPVFDVKQTEGDDSIIRAEIDEKNLYKSSHSDVKLTDLIRVCECFELSVGFEEMSNLQGGYAVGDRIALNSFYDSNAHCGTILHELAHHLLEHTGSRHELPKEIKETEAETVCFLLCQRLGIDRRSEFYLRSYQEGVEIAESFERIDSVVWQVLEKVEEKEAVYA